MGNITIKLDHKLYPITAFTFSGGEEHISLEHLPVDRYMGKLALQSSTEPQVFARIQSSTDFMRLLLTTQVLARIAKSFDLNIPYFPYARQDRIINECEPFSLEMVTSLLNIPCIRYIRTHDLHSEVALKQIPMKLKETKQIDCIRQNVGLVEFIKTENPVLLAPDKGALEKSVSIAKEYGLPLLIANKVRENGKITHSEIPSGEFASDKTILICDDICDGGATFYNLAALLKNQYGASEVVLYVTHGIFSQGYGQLAGYIDKIYTTNTFLPTMMPTSGEITLFIHNLIQEV